MDSNMASGKLGQAAAYKRQRQNLQEQIDDVNAKALEVRVAEKALLEKLSAVEEERDALVEFNGQLKAKMIQLGDLEAASNQQPGMLLSLMFL